MITTDLKMFVKRHEKLICIDSDGTAMDVMNIKHKRCFGPALVEEWGLQDHGDKVLRLWNKINLFSATRGMNRFLTLYLALCKINEQITPIEGLDDLKQWTECAEQLSNQTLKTAAETSGSEMLKRALNWSQLVNCKTVLLTYDDKKPFVGVKEFLRGAKDKADIAIVSSAGYAVIREEWEYHGLLQYVGVIAAQEDGSKKECISQLVQKGYRREDVLMIGDALTDLKAAKDSEVLFYPMQIDAESDSWKSLHKRYFDEFMTGIYQGSEEALIKKFTEYFDK